LGVFYLWVYVRRAPGLELFTGTERSDHATVRSVPLEPDRPALVLGGVENSLKSTRSVVDRKRG
jgi:hypothetical protein